MDKIMGVILVIALVCVCIHIFVSVLEFVCEVPKQLKRIADALEKRK